MCAHRHICTLLYIQIHTDTHMLAYLLFSIPMHLLVAMCVVDVCVYPLIAAPKIHSWGKNSRASG